MIKEDKARYASQVYQNTDKQLWQKDPSDHCSPKIHVTAGGSIGINVGGHCVVMNVEKWHQLGLLRCNISEILDL